MSSEDDRLVLPAESSYLLLVARRVHNASLQAANAGTEYHPSKRFEELQCGLRARMVIEPREDKTVRPVVYLAQGKIDRRRDDSLAIRLQAASEILGGAAYFHGDVDGVSRFSLDSVDT